MREAVISNPLCDEAFQVQTNVFFQFTQAAVIVFDITGISLLVYVATLILLIKIFHINLRILLVSLLFLLMVRSLLTLYRSFRFALRILTSQEDHCKFLEESVSCRVLSDLATAPSKGFPIAFTAIALERAVATFFYNRYEKWQYPFALIFIPPAWCEIALSIRRALLMQRAFATSKTSYKSYCSSVNIQIVNYASIMNIEIPIIIGCFILFCIVYMYNKRKMKLNLVSTVDPLSSRYQNMENMKTSITMLMASTLYTFCITINLGGVLLLARLRISDLTSFAIFKEITSFAVPIFVNAFALLLILKVHPIRVRTLRWLHLASQKGAMQTAVRSIKRLNSFQHMKVLQEMWSVGNR